MSKKAKTAAKASKALATANEFGIEFDHVTAANLLAAMADAQQDGESSKALRDNLSIEFCALGVSTVIANDGIARETVVTAFGKELDTHLPRMAVEGSPFVETKTAENGEIRHSWKGHGANVKSIARGCAEFVGVEHTDDNGEQFNALIDVATAESFTQIKKSVEAARRYANEDDEARELREAKEALREASKVYISLVIGESDIEMISNATGWLVERTEVYQGDIAAVAAIEADVENDEAEVEAA